jgi:hypothetical protein
VLEWVNEMRKWLDEVTAKQETTPLSEDPAFLTKEVDAKITRVNSVLTRVSSIPKPKEPKKAKRSNIKMENVKINGEDAENFDDFIKFDNPEGETSNEEPKTSNEEQQKENQEE